MLGHGAEVLDRSDVAGEFQEQPQLLAPSDAVLAADSVIVDEGERPRQEMALGEHLAPEPRRQAGRLGVAPRRRKIEVLHLRTRYVAHASSFHRLHYILMANKLTRSDVVPKAELMG
jgi:hypothetical protein